MRRSGRTLRSGRVSLSLSRVLTLRTTSWGHSVTLSRSGCLGTAIARKPLDVGEKEHNEQGLRVALFILSARLEVGALVELPSASSLATLSVKHDLSSATTGSVRAEREGGEAGEGRGGLAGLSISIDRFVLRMYASARGKRKSCSVRLMVFLGAREGTGGGKRKEEEDGEEGPRQ